MPPLEVSKNPMAVAQPEIPCREKNGLPRSPSALSYPFLVGFGFPYSNRLQKKKGTLILTSLLEDLGKDPWMMQFPLNK